MISILKNILNNRKVILFLFLIGFVNVIFISVFCSDYFYRGDTAGYIETAQWLGGDKSVEVLPYRLLKPMGLIMPMFFEKIGLMGEYGLQFQNVIFYFLAIILLFDLVFELTKNKRQSIFAVILFITAWPFLGNALSFLTDMTGWFFYLFPAWLLVKLHYSEKVNFYYCFLLGFITGIGFLFKESAIAFLFLMLGYLIFLNKEKLLDRIKLLTICGLAFFVPVLISSFFVYQAVGYTFLDWFFRSGGTIIPDYSYYGFGELFFNIGITFTIGWFFVFFGIIKEVKEQDKLRIKWILAFILPALSGFVWCVSIARILYIAFPLLVLLGSGGLIFIENRKGKFLSIILLFIFVLFNFLAPRIATYSQVRDFFNI